MKRYVLFFALGIGLFSSCSTAYRVGQTPDDVYYSPAPEMAMARLEKNNEQRKEEYEEYSSRDDNRFLHMKVANRSRWTTLDDYDYWYNSQYDFCRYNLSNNYSYTYYTPYKAGWGISPGYSSPYLSYPNNGYGWNCPVYTLIKYSNPTVNPGYTSGSNLSAYGNKSHLHSNYPYNPKTGAYQPPANSRGSNSNLGSLLKKIFTTTPSGTTISHDRPVRTFDNSSNSSSTPATNSNAGGNSGGFKSTGSSASGGRGGKKEN